MPGPSQWLEIFGLVFLGFSAEADPRDPLSSPGPAPHINFRSLAGHQGGRSKLQLLGFWQISGRTWTRDPSKRVGFGKWCRTHTKLAPETNSKAASLPFFILLAVAGQATRYLKAVWLQMFGPVFQGFSAEADPKDPP